MNEIKIEEDKLNDEYIVRFDWKPEVRIAKSVLQQKYNDTQIYNRAIQEQLQELCRHSNLEIVEKGEFQKLEKENKELKERVDTLLKSIQEKDIMLVQIKDKVDKIHNKYFHE